MRRAGRRQLLAALRAGNEGDGGAADDAAGSAGGARGGGECGHGGAVRGLLYVAGGRRLMSYGAEGRVRLWDPERAARGAGGAVKVNYGHVPRESGRACGAVHMAERPGGRVVCLPRGRDVVAVDVESGRQVRRAGQGVDGL